MLCRMLSFIDHELVGFLQLGMNVADSNLLTCIFMILAVAIFCIVVIYFADVLRRMVAINLSKAAVVYYSMFGNAEKLAKALAAGLQSGGVEVDVANVDAVRFEEIL